MPRIPINSLVYRAFSWVIALLLGGCSISQSDKVRVSISHTQSETIFSDVALRGATPISTSDMDCFLINITGNGVIANAVGGIGPTTVSCLGLELTSTLVSLSSIRTGVDLAASPGKNRTIQIFGAKTTQVGAKCPSGEGLQSLYDTGKYAALYLIGSVNTDIYGGTTIEVSNTYSSSTAKDVVLECAKSEASSAGSNLLLLTGLSPSRGRNAGGSEITLTGLGFQSGMTVKIGQESCSGVTVSSTTQAQCTMQSSTTSATTDVTATNSAGITATLSGAFKYLATDVWAQIAEGPSKRDRFITFWTGTKMLVWGGVDDSTIVGGGYLFDPSANSWSSISTTNEPTYRQNNAAIWTGSKMMTWGGNNATEGNVWDSITDSWSTISTQNQPAVTRSPTAVWTGSKMIVWGGYEVGSSNSGGVYDSATTTWEATSTGNSPDARYMHSAVWTGNTGNSATANKMIIWGGIESGDLGLNTGGIYDPNIRVWTATPTGGAPEARYEHCAVWTGNTGNSATANKMIVWGGRESAFRYLNSGGVYDPASNTWVDMSVSNVPSGRSYFNAVWTGNTGNSATANKMIIWGGGTSTPNDTGGTYDPGSNSWTTLGSSGFLPTARTYAGAVWTGIEFVVWGGSEFSLALKTGGIFVP